ncbi:MAG: hypothetical protein PSV24_04050, partial [Rhodoferax sp.]|nr:hypothetical protein [Rhodoferax sp.]
SSFRRRALSERNKTFVIALTCPAPWVLLLLPLHLVLLLLEGVVLSVLKFDERYLRQIYIPVFGGLLRRRLELRTERVAARQRCSLASTTFFTAFDWFPYKLRMLLRHGLPRMR